MRKWQIKRDGNVYIPQYKDYEFWKDVDIYPTLYNRLKISNYPFACDQKNGDYYRPRFINIEGAIYCAKQFDLICKEIKKKNEEPSIYYLDENYMIENKR